MNWSKVRQDEYDYLKGRVSELEVEVAYLQLVIGQHRIGIDWEICEPSEAIVRKNAPLGKCWVSAKDNPTLYLHPGGKAENVGHWYQEIEDAHAAIAEWKKVRTRMHPAIPQWHHKPNAPGLWVCRSWWGKQEFTVKFEQSDLNDTRLEQAGEWYGPIQEGKPDVGTDQ